MSTVWQDNAARFASRLDNRDEGPIVRAFRNAGVRDAIRCYRLGHPDLATSLLLTSVERQARLIGLRDVHLPRSTNAMSKRKIKKALRPLTLEQLLDTITNGGTHEGLHVFWLGEDCDEAFIPFEPGTPDRPQGSGDLHDARLALAIQQAAAWEIDAADALSDWTERHVVLTKHVSNCPGDACDENGCDESPWWVTHADPDTPGALRVMWWSW